MTDKTIEDRNDRIQDQIDRLPETTDKTDHLLLESTDQDIPDARGPEQIPYTNEWKAELARASNSKFDDQMAKKFLQYYALTGRKYDSAAAAGVHYMTIRRAEKESEIFAELVECSRQFYLESLEREAHRRGFEGILKPIVAGKDPEIVTYERVYSDTLLLAMLKKHDREGYGNGGDKGVTVNVNTGVLAINRPTESDELAGKPESLGIPVEDVIEGEVVK